MGTTAEDAEEVSSPKKTTKPKSKAGPKPSALKLAPKPTTADNENDSEEGDYDGADGEGKQSSRSHKKRRCLWNNEEDNKLILQVQKHGPRQWSLIAAEMGYNGKDGTVNHRTGKQCRERWHNHLDPSIKKGIWGKEEDKLLIDSHRKGQVKVSKSPLSPFHPFSLLPFICSQISDLFGV